MSRMEALEGRWLLAAMDFHVNVNFQPPRTTVPSGYVADTGAVFGDRGNGFPKPGQALLIAGRAELGDVVIEVEHGLKHLGGPRLLFRGSDLTG